MNQVDTSRMDCEARQPDIDNACMKLAGLGQLPLSIRLRSRVSSQKFIQILLQPTRNDVRRLQKGPFDDR